MEKKKAVNVLELAYRLAYGLGASFLVAALVIGLSVGTSNSASAAPDMGNHDPVTWCHCEPNGNCATLYLSQESLEKAGHVDASGAVLHAGDHPGACEDPTDEPTEEPTDEPTDAPTATTPPSDPGETPTVAAPSGGGGDDDSSTVIIPVTGVSVIEGGQSNQLFLENAGYGLLGLGLVLQGIAVKKRREEA